MGNRRRIGAAYEEQAAEYLEAHGYEILERNFRCRLGEIDLIAREGKVLVFLEVKYRRTDSCGSPAEAVTLPKQRTICRVADYYRMVHRIPERQPCRFDVIAITDRSIEVIKNAFFYQ